MKLKVLLSAVILMFFYQTAWSQKTSLLKMGLQERKTEIKNMSAKEKAEALKRIKENIVLSELQIPETEQEQFLDIYEEYQRKQREIKNKFRSRDNYTNMTEAEAKAELESSFLIGQQLLDLRKTYADKFSNVISPQQILQLFQTEGMMRNKMMKHQMPAQK